MLHINLAKPLESTGARVHPVGRRDEVMYPQSLGELCLEIVDENLSKIYTYFAQDRRFWWYAFQAKDLRRALYCRRRYYIAYNDGKTDDTEATQALMNGEIVFIRDDVIGHRTSTGKSFESCQCGREWVEFLGDTNWR